MQGAKKTGERGGCVSIGEDPAKPFYWFVVSERSIRGDLGLCVEIIVYWRTPLPEEEKSKTGWSERGENRRGLIQTLELRWC